MLLAHSNPRSKSVCSHVITNAHRVHLDVCCIVRLANALNLESLAVWYAFSALFWVTAIRRQILVTLSWFAVKVQWHFTVSYKCNCIQNCNFSVRNIMSELD